MPEFELPAMTAGAELCQCYEDVALGVLQVESYRDLVPAGLEGTFVLRGCVRSTSRG